MALFIIISTGAYTVCADCSLHCVVVVVTVVQIPVNRDEQLHSLSHASWAMDMQSLQVGYFLQTPHNSYTINTFTYTISKWQSDIGHGMNSVVTVCPEQDYRLWASEEIRLHQRMSLYTLNTFTYTISKWQSEIGHGMNSVVTVYPEQDYRLWASEEIRLHQRMNLYTL